jgi:hypothetical protein
VALALVLLHHSPRGDLFRSFTVSPRSLRALFDVFVLALLFAADASKMLSSRHLPSPSDELIELKG